MSFEIIDSIDKENKRHLFKLVGELDIYHTPAFKEKTSKIYSEKPMDIEIDGTDLDYVDSTGLGAFIHLLKQAKKNGHKIYLINIKPNIKKLFVITKLDEMFIFQGGDND